LEVFPNSHSNIGTWRGNFDNSGTLYVNNQAINDPAVTGWDTTNTFTFIEPCDEPTVYAIHAIDGERDEEGTAGVGGIIGSISHCNEIIVTNSAWKCVANDVANGYPVPPAWNTVGYDDGSWEKAKNYGIATGNANHWNEYTMAQDPPYHVPRDAVSPFAHWIWTNEADSHDDVYCRYESFHAFKNCKPAADRYRHDYPFVDDERVELSPFDHFQQLGKDAGRIWHSELCSARCEVEHVAYDWIDASDGGIEPAHEDMQRGHGTQMAQGEDAGLDDAFFEVALPFPFPFFGQQKFRALISTNGYLTFSGEHSNYGDSSTLPNPAAPNDAIYPFWTDLDMTDGGQIFTKYIDGSSLTGSNTGSCKYGIADGAACCALTCGTCGGTGCEQRPGGEASCCYHGIAADDAVTAAGTPVPLCRDNLGRGPCKIDESFFVIEWKEVPFCCGAGAPPGSNTFEVVLYENGAMRFQYQNMAYNPNPYAIPVTGIENAGGTEANVIADCHDPADQHAMVASATGGGNNMHVSAQCQRARNFQSNSAVLLADSCTSAERTFSVGWCEGYDAGTAMGDEYGWTQNTGGTQQQAEACDYAYADRVCQEKYGGQLASIKTQDEYNILNHLITGAVTEHYMLGLHSDGQGNWEYSDGTACGAQCMNFLRSHSADQLAGTAETNMVFNAADSQGGTGGFHDCCPIPHQPTDWVISGFVCEAYAASGTFTIGLGRNRAEAEDFCQDYYGGHLASIHNQEDYDKIADLSQHYTQPLMIGLVGDGAGNWEWMDGSQVDNEWLVAHSFDGLDWDVSDAHPQGETQVVFYPPVCQTGWEQTRPGQPGDGSGSDTCDGDSQEPERFNHALHTWGDGTERMAFVCQSDGSQRRLKLGTDVPGYEIPGCTNPAAKNYDSEATMDDGSCTGGGH
jgi:hypothetical protein